MTVWFMSSCFGCNHIWKTIAYLICRAGSQSNEYLPNLRTPPNAVYNVSLAPLVASFIRTLMPMPKCFLFPSHYCFLSFCCASWARNFSFSTSRQSLGSGSLPSVTRAEPEKADRPAYNWYPSPEFSAVSRALKVMGWFPRNRLRISIMPRRHSPNPFFSCWHLVGSVSAKGDRRQSAAVFR